MKLGEIKAEAINLMGLLTGQSVDYTNIDTLLNDDTFASYLHAMNGSLNRALVRLYEAGLLGEASKIIESNDIGIDGYDVSQIEDYGKLERVYITDGNFRKPILANVVSGKIWLKPLSGKKYKYLIVYRKKAPFVKADAKSDDELNIPYEIGLKIPYFIKGELYADENASAAASAMSIFEQYLTTALNDGGVQACVETVIRY